MARQGTCTSQDFGTELAEAPHPTSVGARDLLAEQLAAGTPWPVEHICSPNGWVGMNMSSAEQGRTLQRWNRIGGGGGPHVGMHSRSRSDRLPQRSQGAFLG